jgi:hypothetical protein
VPDWLAEMAPAEAEPVTPTPPAEADAPDWLAEIAPAEGEVPDWLAEIAPAEARPEVAPPQPPTEAEVPDWLAEMAPAEAEPEAAPPPPPAEGEVPDWLAEMAPAEARPEVAPPQPPTEAEVPDWLAEMAPAEAEPVAPTPAEPEAAPPQPPTEAEVPDWLAEMAPAEAEPEAAPPPSPAEGEVPDWLAEIAPAEAEPEAAPPPSPAEGEVPDWLATMIPAEAEPVAPIPAKEEVPDWLATMMPAEAEPVETPLPTEVEVPDWLSTMITPDETVTAAPSAEGEVPAQAEPIEPPPPAEAEVPDWLAEMAPAEAEPEVAPPPTEDKAPDWLTEMAPVEPTAPMAEAEVPDWLAEMAPAEAEPEVASPTTEGEAPDWLAEMAPAEAEPEAAPPPPTAAEVPDWLTEMAPAAAGSAAPLAEAEVPDWLTAAPPPSTQEDIVAPETGEVAIAGELPDWVTQLRPSEAVPSPEESGLAQAEIPGWLEAMRPGVAPTPAPEEEEEVEVEGSGLLAGIAGVVQPASVVAAPPSVPAKAEPISIEAMLAQANMWQELIARSTQPSPLHLPQVPVKRARDRVERWLVYGVVLLAVLIPILAGVDLSSIFSLDEPLTKEAPVAYDFINEKVVENTAVLIAFDYDPSHMGELDVQAEVLLHHLVRRQARIIAVSLRPEGAGLAQHLFDDVLISADYQAGQDYVNLGYLPGEAVGIRSLHYLPQRFQGEAFDGRDLKDALIFEGDTSFALDKVSLIIVLTGDANDLRWWVEQTTILENDSETELLLVAGVSAAIEPLVRPYYDMTSPQIDALIVGLAGAAAYESKMNWQDGPAHIRISGQVVGQVALLALILIGMIIYGILDRGDRGQ